VIIVILPGIMEQNLSLLINKENLTKDWFLKIPL
jgi:hypothetical protein